MKFEATQCSEVISISLTGFFHFHNASFSDDETNEASHFTAQLFPVQLMVMKMGYQPRFE